MSGIDYEIEQFFSEIASLRMDIQDYREWCEKYKAFHYPDWTMKNGKQISLSSMTDKHLKNAISMIEKNDPDNGWLKILRQEKQYREIRLILNDLNKRLDYLEKVSDNVF